MKYFFISGMIGRAPFCMAADVYENFFSRKDVEDAIKRSDHPTEGTIVIQFYKEMTKEEYDIFNRV